MRIQNSPLISLTKSVISLIKNLCNLRYMKFIQYIKDSRAELKKVIWPDQPKIINDTLVVIVVSLVTALFIGVADFFFTKILDLFIR